MTINVIAVMPINFYLSSLTANSLSVTFSFSFSDFAMFMANTWSLKSAYFLFLAPIRHSLLVIAVTVVLFAVTIEACTCILIDDGMLICTQ